MKTNTIINIFNFFRDIFKINNNKILFISENSIELSGNLKLMYNYIPNSYNKIVLLYQSRSKIKTFRENIHLIYHLFTAKYIFLDDLLSYTSTIKFNKNQQIIQLWHGTGAYKKFGYSRAIATGGDLNKIHQGYKKYNFVSVSSKAIRKDYAEAFGIGMRKVIATGVPRTDLLFDNNYINSKKEKLYKAYPFLKNKKVILFAPTYRGTNIQYAGYNYNMIDVDNLYNELHKDYIFIYKWHPFHANNIREGRWPNLEINGHDDFYYDFSDYPEMNDLLLISDILITDYSSSIFDYSLLNKPIIYYVHDFEKYNDSRGFYYNFNDYVYGMVVKNKNKLIDAIKKEDLMPKKRKGFIDKFMSACDGKSTEKTYNAIFKK